MESIELKKRLTDAVRGGRTRLVVDLTETTYFSDTALDAVYKAHLKVSALGGALVIVNVDANIAKIFEITAFDEVFTIQETREAAIAALDTAAS